MVYLISFMNSIGKEILGSLLHFLYDSIRKHPYDNGFHMDSSPHPPIYMFKSTECVGQIIIIKHGLNIDPILFKSHENGRNLFSILGIEIQIRTIDILINQIFFSLEYYIYSLDSYLITLSVYLTLIIGDLFRKSSNS
jgi:hypothetical protein